MKTDIRIKSIEPIFVDSRARTPLKFGAVVMDFLPLAYMKATVENGAGKVAEGWGSMCMAYMGGWPTLNVPADARSKAMVEISTRIAKLFAGYKGQAHPIDIYHDLEGQIQVIADAVTTEMKLAEKMPHLCALVCASPVDAAIHDAYGKVNKCPVWDAYGKEFCSNDLSRQLGPKFKGKYVANYIHKMPKQVPAFHLVGGLDKLRESEIDDNDPKDDLPVTLDQWIRYEGLHCLKVKLRGSDLNWDIQRMLDVTHIAHEEHDKMGLKGLYFSADTNEQCENPEYIVEMLTKLKERAPREYEELLYVEQPTERDLHAHRWDMRGIAKLKPVLIDESLTSLEDFDLAMELGWSGVALKACKCQSSALVHGAKAEAAKIPYMVQDLTCPSLSLIHSIALAAHFSTMMGVETNSRQFFPAVNEFLEPVHPGICKLTDGKLNTSTIKGPGIGYQAEKLDLSFLKK